MKRSRLLLGSIAAVVGALVAVPQDVPLPKGARKTRGPKYKDGPKKNRALKRIKGRG